MRLGHFNEITEHIIEAHFQRGDAGGFQFALLQLRDPILAFARAMAQFIELATKPFANDAAFAQGQRWFIHNRARNQRDYFG